MRSRAVVLLLNFILATYYVVKIAEGAGTIKADEFANLEADAYEINSAMSWFYSSKTPFLRILPHRTCEQRYEIYNRLDKWKKNKTRYYEGFDTAMTFVIMGCYRCGPAYYSYWIKRSMFSESAYWQSRSLNIKALIELLVLLSVDDPMTKESVIQNMAWQPAMNLKRFWKDNVPGDVGDWGTTLLERKRDDSEYVDPVAAHEDAMLLLKESDMGFASHREKLDEVLFEKSIPQTQLILEEFRNANNNIDLWDVIRGQLGISSGQLDGDLRKAYLDLIMCLHDKTDYLATRLKETMDGLGTDDTGLGRLIIWRSEIDLVEVSNHFQRKYGKSLRDAVRDDTSGFQRNFLLAFMGA